MGRAKIIILDLVLVAIAAAVGYAFFVADPFGAELFEKPVSEEEQALKVTTAAFGTISDTADLAKGAAEESVRAIYPVQTEEGKARGLAVLMYHNVYDPAAPPPGLDDNYISTEVLREELQYLKDNKYSFPTWEEVRKYVDGEIDLPEKSVVLTFDDGTKGFMENGVPLLEEFDIPATAFIIASKNGPQWKKFAKKHPLITLGSHSYDMHRAGGNIGHNGIMTALPLGDIIDDLNKSEDAIGGGDAFAYPYGDYDPEGKCRNAVEMAGFLVGFTTVYGKVYPEADPYLLPRIRINGSTPIGSFIDMI